MPDRTGNAYWVAQRRYDPARRYQHYLWDWKIGPQALIPFWIATVDTNRRCKYHLGLYR